MKTYVLSEDGTTNVEVPETCKCGHGPDGHDCSLCIVCGVEAKEESREERIARLRGEVEEAEKAEKEARIRRALLEAALYVATGDEEAAARKTAFVRAQQHEPGAHEEFMHLSRLYTAKRILAGHETLEDSPAFERAAVKAELDRLKGSVPA